MALENLEFKDQIGLNLGRAQKREGREEKEKREKKRKKKKMEEIKAKKVWNLDFWYENQP